MNILILFFVFFSFSLYSIEEILAHGMVPIVNENDAAVSGNKGYTTENVFSDNDALASIVAGRLGAQVLMLLTDVEGVYDRPPSEVGSKIMDRYVKGKPIVIGDKSTCGRGGMSSKIDSALRALDRNVEAVVVASGGRPRVIADVLAGEKVGTLFVESALEEVETKQASEQAIGAKNAARQLQALTSEERSFIMKEIARALRDNVDAILVANQLDLDAASQAKLDSSLLQRLKITSAKIDVLAAGFEQLAEINEPLGKMLKRTEMAEGLNLTQITVPIGVLLIVFESRPDSLPQICALSLRSGNGLLLKGGKEAEKSNEILHEIIVNTVYEASFNKVSRDIVGLVVSRDEVTELLKLEKDIDLVIPRGGKKLVEHVKANTRIPGNYLIL